MLFQSVKICKPPFFDVRDTDEIAAADEKKHMLMMYSNLLSAFKCSNTVEPSFIFYVHVSTFLEKKD